MTAKAMKKEKHPQQEEILTPDAIAFLQQLHHKFNPLRLTLLEERAQRQKELNHGNEPHFLTETKKIREDQSWKVAPPPKDLLKRYVEITGPTDRKMVINALNSGANIFMADFEDANSPTWSNLIEGHINLHDAIEGTISFTSPEGKEYRLNKERAVLMVRPRGWHLEEKHFLVNGEPISGSLFDFGLYFFHQAKRLISKGTGPYFYLPKLESHREARLWNEVFVFSQQFLGIPNGTIRATVLIETILAAFEMEEILYELRDHSAGLNAGRWDYIFSIIKKFSEKKGFLLPDRDQITMTVPFMRAYTSLLIHTCHKREIHAMGGMAAFIPSRKNKEVNDLALKKVREDKARESQDGFDGTWVAHPDLVPIAREEFERVLKNQVHQIEKKRNDVRVEGKELINFSIANGTITEEGVRHNINVGLQYLGSWLQGVGAAAIFNLMEDAATAEISRAQIWQWTHHNAIMTNGQAITLPLIKEYVEEEMTKIKQLYGPHFSETAFAAAKELFVKLIETKSFIPFLTVPAYQELV